MGLAGVIMALKSILTVDDATVVVDNIVLFQDAAGDIWADFNGHVNKQDGSAHTISSHAVKLTVTQANTVKTFAANVGIPALKAANGI